MACWRSSAYMMLVHRPIDVVFALFTSASVVRQERTWSSHTVASAGNQHKHRIAEALGYPGLGRMNWTFSTRFDEGDWSGAGRRPVGDRPRDLPAMAERIIDPAQQPSVLLAHGADPGG